MRFDFDWCSRWDLNPHTRRAYASETYVSTIPPPERVKQTQTQTENTKDFLSFTETFHCVCVTVCVPCTGEV